MDSPKLTESLKIWLNDLANGDWHSVRALAAGRLIDARGGHGAVANVFSRLHVLGLSEWRVLNDVSEYRITDLGRHALSAGRQ